MNAPASDKPSLRKRVLLTLFLILPFVFLIVLMYALAFTLQEQGKSNGGAQAESAVE